LRGVASFGRRPSVTESERVLLETHVFDWPRAWDVDAGYGRLITVQLLHWLHEERRYGSMRALRDGIAADVVAARDWWSASETARDPG
jgi:riboflavin kinase/FMN adenylyltransferase